MSHFSMLVITDEHPDQNVLDRALAPWHEFECTGIDNQYVLDVDKTEEAREDFRTSTATMLRDAEGKLHDAYDERFYRDKTQAELDAEDEPKFLQRKRTRFVPDGYEEVQVPLIETTDFATWVSEYYGAPIVRSKSEIDLSDEHKYGYTLVTGRDVKVIDRTNPNKRWDWWVIGGRYSGKLYVKEGALAHKGRKSWTNENMEIPGFDVAKKSDLDFDAMRKKAQEDRLKWALDCCKKAKLEMEDLNAACRADPICHKLWMEIEDVHARPRGNDYSEWVKTQHADGKILAKFLSTCWDLPKVPSNWTIEQWIEEAPPITAWGVVMDNQWFEKGEMGWWGMSSNDKHDWEEHFNSLWDLIRDDQYITVVDCHI